MRSFGVFVFSICEEDAGVKGEDEDEDEEEREWEYAKEEGEREETGLEEIDSDPQ